MFKKIIAGLCIAAIPLCAMASDEAVDRYEVNMETGVLTLEGSPDGAEKYDMMTFALKNGAENITFLQFNAGEGGSYSLDIDMEGLASGTYTAKLRVKGKTYESEIYYSSSGDALSTVKEILGKETAKELEIYLDIKNKESVPLGDLNADAEFISASDPEKHSKILFEY